VGFKDRRTDIYNRRTDLGEVKDIITEEQINLLKFPIPI
jgi:hypothetical protein